VKRKIAILFTALGVTGTFVACGGYSQAPGSHNRNFQQTDLVADIAGTAAHTDPLLLNPWGIAFEPGRSFWISANNLGSAKVLDASGSPAMPLVVGIPGISGSSLPSTPTGIVFNPIAQDFIVRGTPAQFVFATEDGTVSTWAEMNGNLPTDAILARDDSAQGAVYKGLLG